MNKADSAVQLGMFGVANQLESTHVVAAHTRVLASGEQVFVPEHLRWNRGKTERASTSRQRAVEVAEEQPSLFGSPIR